MMRLVALRGCARLAAAFRRMRRTRRRATWPPAAPSATAPTAAPSPKRRGPARRPAARAHRDADARVPRRQAPGDGDAPDRQGLHRRADRRAGGLVRRAEEVGGSHEKTRLPQARRRGLAGRLRDAPAPSKARVVVIGGGFGGATAAKYIRLWDPSIDVVLVERDAAFVSCPISNLVLAGYSSMQDITPRLRRPAPPRRAGGARRSDRRSTRRRRPCASRAAATSPTSG